MKRINRPRRAALIIPILILLLSAQGCYGQAPNLSDFKKTILSRDFISEGVAVADINNDGKMDVIAGYHWFEAPTWKQHGIAPSRIFDPRKEYSNSFLNMALDVNMDGWMDVVIVDYPGTPGYWFENPKNEKGPWKKHIIADGIGISNESPNFVDIDGDGRLDILCGDVDKRQVVWLQAPLTPGETEWKRFPISLENVPGTENFSHGFGFGDINGDGINDVIIREGWFEGKEDKKSGDWVFHPTDLGEPCSQMWVMDIDGDGRNDVLSASAHSLGIWWHRQNEDLTFTTETISTITAQTHATILADLDGDGHNEFITGKRFLAHNGNDPGDDDAPILLYFNITPGEKLYFKEYIIDLDSGVGLNIAVADMNGDQKPDIIIANKNGVFLLENHLKK